MGILAAGTLGGATPAGSDNTLKWLAHQARSEFSSLWNDEVLQQEPKPMATASDAIGGSLQDDELQYFADSLTSTDSLTSMADGSYFGGVLHYMTNLASRKPAAGDQGEYEVVTDESVEPPAAKKPRICSNDWDDTPAFMNLQEDMDCELRPWSASESAATPGPWPRTRPGDENAPPMFDVNGVHQGTASAGGSEPIVLGMTGTDLPECEGDPGAVLGHVDNPSFRVQLPKFLREDKRHAPRQVHAVGSVAAIF